MRIGAHNDDIRQILTFFGFTNKCYILRRTRFLVFLLSKTIARDQALALTGIHLIEVDLHLAAIFTTTVIFELFYYLCLEVIVILFV